MSLFPSILILLIIYTFQRAMYLWWNASSFANFSDPEIVGAFLVGLRYDLAAICQLLLIYLPFHWILTSPWCQRWPRYLRFMLQVLLLLVINLLFFVLNVIDAEMVDIVGQRFNFGALFNFSEVPGKTSAFVVYYWPLFTGCLIALLAFPILSLIGYQIFPAKDRRGKSYLWMSLATFVLLFIGARGGLQGQPLNVKEAAVGKSPLIFQLTLNTTFNFIDSIFEEMNPPPLFTSDLPKDPIPMETIVPAAQSVPATRWAAPSQKQNIVILILESFNFDYMEASHAKRSYTPFLDELGKKGSLFVNNFANARRSIDGVAAVLGGIPAYSDVPYILSTDAEAPYAGIGSLLEKSGYHTSFFHGARNGTMKFDVMMKKFGIQHYFGLNEYPRPEDHDGTWGIPDHKYLSYVADQLNTFPQPFFSATFTLSSHHPFTVPPEFKGKFPKGTLDIHESIGYTDYSLRLFFDKASKMPWYQNTLFILTADHTYKSTTPENQSFLGRYRTPLIFFHPRGLFPQLSSTIITQQADVLPTVLDYVGTKDRPKQICLGRSLFKPGPRAVVNYIDRRHLLITDHRYLTSFQGGNFEVYDIQDSNQKNPLHDAASLGPLSRLLTDKVSEYYRYFTLSKSVSCQ